MAKVALNFEDFNGVIGDDGAPTMAVVTAGSFTNHRGGARTASMSGPRYGVMRNQTLERRWTIATTGIFTLEGKCRIRKIGDTTGSGINYMWGGTRNSDSLQILIMGHHGNGNWTTFDYINGTTDSGVAITIGAVYDYVMTLNQGGGVITAYKFEVRLEGVASWTTIISRTSQSLAASDRLQLLNTTNQGATRWIGHLSAFGSAQLAAMSESIDPWPTPVVDWAAGLDFYMGSQTGASTNDGGSTSMQLPMATTALNDELKYGLGSGDTLLVDNTSAVWDIGAIMIAADMSGTTSFTLRFLGPTENRRAHKDISGATAGGSTTWTLESDNIWRTTDGGATDLTKSIVYENGVALPSHPVGANFAAVSATLNGVRGFYVDYAVDGTGTIYVALEGENPNTNGKLYYRSRDRLQGASNSGPLMDITNWTNFRVYDFGADYLGYVSKTDNDDLNTRGCVIDLNPSGSGYCDISGVKANGTGKHFIGMGISGTAAVTVSNAYVGAGHPYAGVGNATSIAVQVLDNSTTATASLRYIHFTAASDPVSLNCHGTGGFPDGRIASLMLYQFNALGSIDNSGGTAVLLTTVRGSCSSIAGDGISTLLVDKDTNAGSVVNGTRYDNSMITRMLSFRLPD